MNGEVNLLDDFIEETGHLWVVAIYDEYRAYGGPEEGGWYYTVSELNRLVGARRDEQEAYDLARRWNERNWQHLWARSSYDGPVAHVIELGRMEDQYADQRCHMDYDVDPEDLIQRWDIPTHLPEGRPHYC